MNLLETKKEYNRVLGKIADMDEARASIKPDTWEDFFQYSYTLLIKKRDRLLREIWKRSPVPHYYEKHGFPLGTSDQMRLF